MESGRAKTGKRKRVDDEWWKELRADWWQELGDHLETEILGRLPAEDVYRYRGVCDEWNVLLSSNYFITEAWPDATINKQPWLLLCDPFPNNPSMAFCFYTQTWKSCFSLSLPDGERSVRCIGSAGGLLLFDRGFEGDNVPVERYFPPPEVCNPYTGKSIKLPPTLTKPWIKLRCIVEDNNGTYKVVVIGYNHNRENIVKMYDGSQQTWKILGPIPEQIMRDCLSELVFCDGSYYCITFSPSPPRIFGFTITTLNERPEPTLAVPIPEPMLVPELQLVMCGSRLLVVAPIEEVEEVVIICEVESLNLSSSNNTTAGQLKEIARMPPTMWDYLKCNRRYLRFKCTAVGDNLCFVRVCERKKSIEVVVYNLSTGLWSRLPICPWMDNYCMDRYLIMATAFQPTLDTQLQ